MLTIEEDVFLDKKKLNIIRKKTKKTQILLFDTQRKIDNYFSKLKFRLNGEYNDIPHFVIDKKGKVLQIFDTDYYSETFKNKNIDKKIIKIAIENLGWLNKNTITGVMNNWIGDIYRNEPYIKSWRNHFYWDRYTEEQILSLSELCLFLCEKHKIEKKIIDTNLICINADMIYGILSKSNYSDIYTDINPSFDYSLILKNEAEYKKRI